MIEKLLVVMLLGLPIFAQDQSEALRVVAGCGLNAVQFTAKNDNRAHPVGRAEQGKALVYFFGDEEMDNENAIHIGGITTRWGIDGKWAGAMEWKAYFFVSVDPGDHRVCTRRQSRFESENRVGSAISLTAEAGQVYYIRLVTVSSKGAEEVALEIVDPAAAQLLMADSEFSVFSRK